MELNEKERAFVEAFIVKEKQERYSQFLASPKRRREILDRFNHKFDFNPKFATLLPKEMRTGDKLLLTLKEKGAPATCHVMVDSLDIDGEELPLKDAVGQVIAHDFGAVLCCISGCLAFYKAEAIDNSWYILERLIP